MARRSALKVFRTPIGFHDAYVAAPSRKAALEAWGADSDLFASGSAELVTDAALTAAPLAAPGEVIKRSRGSLADHLDAAGRARPRPNAKGKAKDKPVEEQTPTAPPKRARPPKPRPTREKVDEAEAAVAALEAGAAAQRAELDRREAKLLEERKALNERQRRERTKAETRLERERTRYDEAMERWRAET
jgi:septal ring factor EnvC (AmiA/AmiB activator)